VDGQQQHQGAVEVSQSGTRISQTEHEYTVLDFEQLVLSLKPEEQTAFQFLWQKATQGTGNRIAGKAAADFFFLSMLPNEQLKRIWTLSDVTRATSLGYFEFVVALKLIYVAQRHQAPTLKRLFTVVPTKPEIPELRGISISDEDKKCESPTPTPPTPTFPPAPAPEPPKQEISAEAMMANAFARYSDFGAPKLKVSEVAPAEAPTSAAPMAQALPDVSHMAPIEEENDEWGAFESSPLPAPAPSEKSTPTPADKWASMSAFDELAAAAPAPPVTTETSDPKMSPRADQIQKGDFVWRKGRRAKVLKIDYTLDPPTLTVVMEDTGEEVGTELDLVQLGPPDAAAPAPPPPPLSGAPSPPMGGPDLFSSTTDNMAPPTFPSATTPAFAPNNTNDAFSAPMAGLNGVNPAASLSQPQPTTASDDPFEGDDEDWGADFTSAPPPAASPAPQISSLSLYDIGVSAEKKNTTASARDWGAAFETAAVASSSPGPVDEKKMSTIEDPFAVARQKSHTSIVGESPGALPPLGSNNNDFFATSAEDPFAGASGAISAPGSSQPLKPCNDDFFTTAATEDPFAEAEASLPAELPKPSNNDDFFAATTGKEDPFAEASGAPPVVSASPPSKPSDPFATQDDTWGPDFPAPAPALDTNGHRTPPPPPQFSFEDVGMGTSHPSSSSSAIPAKPAAAPLRTSSGSGSGDRKPPPPPPARAGADDPFAPSDDWGADFASAAAPSPAAPPSLEDPFSAMSGDPFAAPSAAKVTGSRGPDFGALDDFGDRSASRVDMASSPALASASSPLTGGDAPVRRKSDDPFAAAFESSPSVASCGGSEGRKSTSTSAQKPPPPPPPKPSSPQSKKLQLGPINEDDEDRSTNRVVTEDWGSDHDFVSDFPAGAGGGALSSTAPAPPPAPSPIVVAEDDWATDFASPSSPSPEAAFDVSKPKRPPPPEHADSGPFEVISDDDDDWGADFASAAPRSPPNAPHKSSIAWSSVAWSSSPGEEGSRKSAISAFYQTGPNQCPQDENARDLVKVEEEDPFSVIAPRVEGGPTMSDIFTRMNSSGAAPGGSGKDLTVTGVGEMVMGGKGPIVTPGGLPGADLDFDASGISSPEIGEGTLESVPEMLASFFKTAENGFKEESGVAPSPGDSDDWDVDNLDPIRSGTTAEPDMDLLFACFAPPAAPPDSQQLTFDGPQLAQQDTLGLRLADGTSGLAMNTFPAQELLDKLKGEGYFSEAVEVQKLVAAQKWIVNLETEKEEAEAWEDIEGVIRLKEQAVEAEAYLNSFEQRAPYWQHVANGESEQHNAEIISSLRERLSGITLQEKNGTPILQLFDKLYAVEDQTLEQCCKVQNEARIFVNILEGLQKDGRAIATHVSLFETLHQLINDVMEGLHQVSILPQEREWASWLGGAMELWFLASRFQKCSVILEMFDKTEALQNVREKALRALSLMGDALRRYGINPSLCDVPFYRSKHGAGCTLCFLDATYQTEDDEPTNGTKEGVTTTPNQDGGGATPGTGTGVVSNTGSASRRSSKGEPFPHTAVDSSPLQSRRGSRISTMNATFSAPPINASEEWTPSSGAGRGGKKRKNAVPLRDMAVTWKSQVYHVQCLNFWLQWGKHPRDEND